MSFITVSKGGPSTSIPDGVYVVTLEDISDPRTVTARQGPRAGEEIDLLDWSFVIEDGDVAGEVIEASTSTASGPKSKMYAYLTALFGGKAPAIGQGFDKADLIGRQALATVRTNEDGWPKVENLSALPKAMATQRVAATPAPEAKPARAPRTPTPARTPEAVQDEVAALAAAQRAEAAGSDLPF